MEVEIKRQQVLLFRKSMGSKKIIKHDKDEEPVLQISYVDEEAQIGRESEQREIKDSSKAHELAESSTWKGDTMSPLQIEDILERIFSFCSIASLKDCRLVSRKWRDLSIKAWRGKACLRLSPKTGPTSPRRYRRASIRFRKFIDKMRARADETADNDPFQLRKYPFQSYNLNFINGHPLRNDIIECIAPFTRHLTICVSDTDVDEFQGMYLPLFHKLQSLELNFSYPKCIYCPILIGSSDFDGLTHPNLRRLKICLGFGKEDQDWELFLKRLPNLETLIIELAPTLNTRTGIAARVGILMESVIKATLSSVNLKELEIEHRRVYGASDYFIQLLINCELPLERISIVLKQQTDWKNVRLLLTHYKDSLEYLKICPPDFFDYDERRIQQLVPGELITLNHLKELHLTSTFTFGMYLLSELELPSLQKLVVEKLPNNEVELRSLQELLVEKFRNNEEALYQYIATKKDVRLSLRNGNMYDSLKYFELQLDEKPLSPKTIRIFGHIMPNLEHLIIPTDKQTFRVICEVFKKVKTLNLLEAKNDYEEIDDDALTNVKHPNITDLKNLTDLVISCQRQLRRRNVKFTDLSVTHGILNVPKMHYISMAFKQLSEDVRVMLLNHVQGDVHFQEEISHPECTDLDVNISANDIETGEPPEMDVEEVWASSGEDSSDYDV